MQQKKNTYFTEVQKSRDSGGIPMQTVKRLFDATWDVKADTKSTHSSWRFHTGKLACSRRELSEGIVPKLEALVWQRMTFITVSTLSVFLSSLVSFRSSYLSASSISLDLDLKHPVFFT